MALSLVAILRQIDPAIRRDHCPNRAAIRRQKVRTFSRASPWSAALRIRRGRLIHRVPASCLCDRSALSGPQGLGSAGTVPVCTWPGCERRAARRPELKWASYHEGPRNDSAYWQHDVVRATRPILACNISFPFSLEVSVAKRAFRPTNFKLP